MYSLQVYAVSGAEFYCRLLPNAKAVIFDDCGHFMAIDKRLEAAQNIVQFLEENVAQTHELVSGNGMTVTSTGTEFYHF